MKQWPKDGSPLLFGDLMRPLRKAIKHAYILKRQQQDIDVPWAGPTLGKPELAGCLPPEEALSAKRLKYSLEEQGRTAFDEILGIAVLLGIEQGRRLMRESLSSRMNLMRSLMDIQIEALDSSGLCSKSRATPADASEESEPQQPPPADIPLG